MNKIFNTEIKETNTKILITIRCKKCKFASQTREIFDAREIDKIILEKFHNQNLEIISKPSKQISNIDKSKYASSGEWVFQKIKEKNILQKDKESGINILDNASKVSSKPATIEKPKPSRRRSTTRTNSKKTQVNLNDTKLETDP
jgi:hypothetical protein